MALTDKLSAIGNAIRAKTGGTELLTLDAMPNEIASIETGGGGGVQVEPIVLTGNQSHACSGIIAETYINLFGDTISTNNIQISSYMFNNSKNLIEIPFNINFDSSQAWSAMSMFSYCGKLKKAPKINNFRPSEIYQMFQHCYQLENFPEDYFNNWDWTYLENQTSAYNGNCSSIFASCHSLRKIPVEIFNHMNPVATYYYTYFSSGFADCWSLDELVGLPIPYTATYTSNMLGNTFNLGRRLKRITFATQEDGSPIVVNWKSQNIDLYSYVGWGLNETSITELNNGITADKFVKDDASYQALKNDPDWFAMTPEYSRYNHDSAVETINSLPDTSAYLATAGGTNSIRFRQECGSATDGGAISTLTEEEIAVATAKGWTVTLA